MKQFVDKQPCKGTASTTAVRIQVPAAIALRQVAVVFGSRFELAKHLIHVPDG